MNIVWTKIVLSLFLLSLNRTTVAMFRCCCNNDAVVEVNKKPALPLTVENLQKQEVENSRSCDFNNSLNADDENRVDVYSNHDSGEDVDEDVRSSAFYGCFCDETHSDYESDYESENSGAIIDFLRSQKEDLSDLECIIYENQLSSEFEVTIRKAACEAKADKRSCDCSECN